MKNKTLLGLSLALAALSGSAIAQTQGQSPWMVRARAVQLDFANGQNDLQARVTAENRWIPEVDISYFFSKNLAAELVLTVPQSVDIQVAGQRQGTIKALPPSLLLQYHFTDLGLAKPYVGAGINHTMFFERNNILAGAAQVDRSSTGLALQAGVDFAIDRNWSVNVDVKRINMDTRVRVNNADIGKLSLNPVTVGVGLGYRF